MNSKRTALDANSQNKPSKVPSKKPKNETAVNIALHGQYLGTTSLIISGIHSEVTKVDVLSNDMLSDFVDLLRERKSAAIDDCWKRTPILRSWYLRRPVNFENKPCIISHEESVADFILLLFTESTDVIRQIWRENTLLKPWFRGEDVLIAEKSCCAPDRLVIDYFRAIFQCRIPELIRDVWYNNARIHQLIKSLSVEEAIAELRCLMLNVTFCDEDIRREFLDCLDKCSVIMPMLEEITLQRAKRPYLKILTTQINILDAYFTATVFSSPLEVIHAFHQVIAMRDINKIAAIWDNSSLLQNWYRGEPLNFGTDLNPDVRLVTREELVDDFYLLLGTQAIHTIMKFWHGNEKLRHWCRGQPVDFDQTKRQILHDESLVRHWEAVTQCPVKEVIYDVWVDNLRLHKVIGALSLERTCIILDRMLMNLHNCREEIISEYLQHVDKNNVIVPVLNRLKDLSPLPTEQIALLEKYFIPVTENILADFDGEDDYFRFSFNGM